MEHDEDEKLILKIYEIYYGLMVKQIKQIGIIEENTIQELVQDCILRLIEHIETLKHLKPAQLSLYVKKTAKSIAIRYCRKQHTHEKYAYYAEELPAQPQTPEELYVQKEAKNTIDSIISELPEFYQDLLIYQLMGFKKREICQTLGIRIKDYKIYYQKACNLAMEIYQKGLKYEEIKYRK